MVEHSRSVPGRKQHQCRYATQLPALAKYLRPDQGLGKHFMCPILILRVRGRQKKVISLLEACMNSEEEP
jgi:hypothetical protein